MNGSILIELMGSRNQYQPGEKIYGTVHWNLPYPSEEIDLSLLWYTIKHGTLAQLRFHDGGSTIVDSLLIPGNVQIASQDFEFTIPAGPYSYSGKLFSIIWGVLAIAKVNRARSSLHLTVHPNVA